MKKKLLLLFALTIGLISFSQTNDTAFNRRLNEYVRLNIELKFEPLMDYVHPILFTIATRESMVEMFKKSFDNEEMSLYMDSLVTTGFSNDFQVKETIYRKIDYRMKMRMFIKDTAKTSAEDFRKNLISNLEVGFPNSTVTFNKTTKCFEISAPSIMFGVKDNSQSPWMFLGFQKNEALLKAIYPEEVISHFKLL